MIDIIVADHQEVFRIGMSQVLAAADGVRIVGQPDSPAQLLHQLEEINPHILLLATSFLPAFAEIQMMLKRRQTALLVLAEENDQAAYTYWLKARGVVYRSIGAPHMVNAMRRVARGELFVQNLSSDARNEGTEAWYNVQDCYHR
jgi:DNA-binding NarL/FixJ family response regulator